MNWSLPVVPPAVWSIVIPLISLIVFFLWMLRITLRARASLQKVNQEIAQVAAVLKDLKTNRRSRDFPEHWLSDTYAHISSHSFSKNNPLIELINRFDAMRELATPDIAAALHSVAEHEIDKLEIARETPSSLLLLGIMGTVVGMVVALTTFGTPGLQGDGAAINVGRILSSMFLAFISTGIALLLSVSIRSYLEKVSIQQSTMLSELDSYAFTQLAPYFLPKRDSAIQANLHELMKRQQENLSASLDNSMTTLNAFAEMIEQERTLLQQLTRSLAQEVSTAKGVGQRITVDLEKASGEVSNKLLDALQLVNKEIVGQRTALELSHRNHERLLEESHRLNSKQVEALQNHLIATIELLRENNLEIVKNMQTMTTHFSAHTEDQTTAIDALRQEVAQLSNRLLDAQERQQKNLLQSLQAFLLEQFKEMTRSIGFRRRT